MAHEPVEPPPGSGSEVEAFGSMERIAHDTGPPGTFFVVLTFAGGRQEYFNHIASREQAARAASHLYCEHLSDGLLPYMVEIRMNMPAAFGASAAGRESAE